MAHNLSSGVIANIFSGNEVEDPVLQVISFKMIQSGPHLRHRVRISDGKYSTAACMLATQLNDMVDKDLKPLSVILVERYICNTVNENKQVIIILSLKVLTPGEMVEGVIGSPVLYESLQASNSGNSNTNQQEQQARPTGFNKGSRNDNQVVPESTPVGVHPIASLTPYQNKWTICARVTNKSGIRTWSNSRGQGKLFSMDLLDESGEIRATAFNDQCDKFYNMIEIDKVYYITQAQLKTANKQYSSLKNDYEMTFNPGTQVTLCQQRTNIPAMQFQFVSIDQLEQAEKDSTVDVIGVCKDTEELSTVTQKSTGRELKKRDVQLMDDSGKEIRLTMWGTQAETFNGSLNPILAVKGVKVSDFNGKSLSVLSTSTVQINPDIKESHKLRAWYENVGSGMQTVNLSAQGRVLSAGFGGNLKTIGEAVAEGLGCNDKADYYSIKGVPSVIRRENCLYAACPSDGCNKKVIDMNNGVYRCEKCNKEYDTFNWRLLIQASITDATDGVWATMFQDQAEILLGCNAASLAAKKETDEDAFQAVFNEAVFKEYIFNLRVKMESYNDEKRLKTTVVSVQPLDSADYNRKLIQQLKSLYSLQF